MPPVEAMAAGTPVVATRSGAVVETVQDGKTGFLVDKNNAPALAEAILKLLENDEIRESMGRAGRKRAFEYFTWEQAADQTLQLYETLCN
uniref:glycosyltransferase n=1 Tax=Okeania sp. SIO2F4 TaxID=2607790 RepID=UPI0025D55904|nr:glycosyltransferase family 4 protein [Okeania sp. SIO2F4]